MIKLLVQNQLAADLGEQDSTAELYFSRPAGASDGFVIRMGDERIFCEDWPARTMPDTITIGGTTDLLRGYDDTSRQKHEKDEYVWIEDPTTSQDTDYLSGSPSASRPVIDGIVFNIVPRPDGKFYVMGFFANADGSARDLLALFDIDGNIETDFDANLTGTSVRDVLLSPDGERLLIAGEFTQVDGVAVDGIAVVEADTGDFLYAVDANTGAIIFNVIYGDDGYTYVAGQFTEVGGETVANLARMTWDDTSFVIDTSWDWDITNGPIVKILYHEGNLLWSDGTTNSILLTSTHTVTTNGNLVVIDTTKAPGPAAYELKDFRFGADEIQLDPYDPNYIYGTGNSGLTNDDLFRISTSDYSLDSDFDPALAGDDGLAVGQVDVIVGDEAVTKATGAVASWSPSIGTVGCALWLGNRLWLGGNGVIDAPSYFTFFDFSAPASEIGQYKAEAVYREDPEDPILNVEFSVYTGPVYTTNGVVEEVTVTEPYKVDGDGKWYAGPAFQLQDTGEFYYVRTIATHESGKQTIDYYYKDPPSASIVLVDDGEEAGDPINPGNSLAAPTVGIGGSVYTVSPKYQFNIPVSTDATRFFRMWIFPGASMFYYDVTFGGVTTTYPVTSGYDYFEARISGTTNGNTNLTVDAQDISTASIISVGPLAVSAAAQTSNINFDQIQIQMEADGGPFQGLLQEYIILDWRDAVVGDTFQFANVGPSADQYRFRFRLRSFPRDGIEDKSRAIEINSDWSSWSAYT